MTTAFPKTLDTKKPEGDPWSTHTDSQGYTREVYKTDDGEVFVVKEIINNTATEDFKQKRGAILNFEELFFMHYAQVGSSIKASYEEIAAELKKSSTSDIEKVGIAWNLQDSLISIDLILQEFLNEVSTKATAIFKQTLTEATSEDTIDVAQLNKLLNEKIKNLKQELDNEFKQKLKDNELDCCLNAREHTNAFNADTVFETKTTQDDGSLFIERIESTKITAHDQEHGPAISKVTILVQKKIAENVFQEPEPLYTAYRTSHLVSEPVKISKLPHRVGILSALASIATIGVVAANCSFPPIAIALAAIAVTLLLTTAALSQKENKKNKKLLNESQDKTQATIEAFMGNRIDKNTPIIYNLLTSTHASEKGLIAIDDHFKNQQTQRLRTLIKAQHEYNKEKNKDIKDMFFTLNTPTNTFGREISLENCPPKSDPEMHQVAQSNLIALAIMLYGTKNTNVQNMVTAYKDKESDKFVSAYNDLKAIPIAEETDKKRKHAKDFLKARFDEDTAAYHQYAKETATYVGILSEERKANLIVGCKSGNERTGGILGRIATFLSSSFWSNTLNPSWLFNLDKEYNERGCFSSSAVEVSLCDQGSIPKTGRQSGNIADNFNTNKVEAREMTNISTGSADVLQAHKEDFKPFMPDNEAAKIAIRQYLSTDNALEADENTSFLRRKFHK